MSAIDFAARLAGVPQATIDEVEKAAPHMAVLLRLLKDNEPLIKQAQAFVAKVQPIITEAQPMLTEAMALYAKASPLIKSAMVEFDAIMPAAQDVVAFIESQNQTQTSEPPAGNYP